MEAVEGRLPGADYAGRDPEAATSCRFCTIWWQFRAKWCLATFVGVTFGTAIPGGDQFAAFEQVLRGLGDLVEAAVLLARPRVRADGEFLVRRSSR